MNAANAATPLLCGLVLLIISAVVTPLVAGKRQFAGSLNFIACLLATLCFGQLAFGVLKSGEELSFVWHLLGIAAYPVPMLVDGLSALFLLLISIMASAAAFYCIGYMEMAHYRPYSLRSFYFCFPLFFAGMVGIVTVDDLSTGFTLSWQAMTLASWALIRFDHNDSKILHSANKYLFLMEMAWLSILAAAFLLPSSGWGSSLHELTENLGNAHLGMRLSVFALLIFGFAMKTGMFPLGQMWLPDAHASAPSPVSALLSGVMIKTGVYGLLRTLFWMMPESSQATEGRYLGLFLALMGTLSLFIGTVQAVKQDDAKRLHAYSSIGQMGYILLGLGTAHYFFLSGVDALDALAIVALIGVLYHTINHAVFKGLLFLSTGSVQYATGSKDLDKLGGLIKIMPWTALAAAVASLSIAGVPAVSGFVSKWAIVSSSILGAKNAGIIVIFGIIALLTSAITLACYVKFFGMTFTSEGTQETQNAQVSEVPATLIAPKIFLGIICLAQGFLPWVFLGLYQRVLATSPNAFIHNYFTGTTASSVLTTKHGGVVIDLSLIGGQTHAAFAMPLIILAMFALALALAYVIRKLGGSKARTVPVWLCGYQTMNEMNSYRSRHVFAAFKKFMAWTGADVKHTP